MSTVPRLTGVIGKCLPVVQFSRRSLSLGRVVPRHGTASRSLGECVSPASFNRRAAVWGAPSYAVLWRRVGRHSLRLPLIRPSLRQADVRQHAVYEFPGDVIGRGGMEIKRRNDREDDHAGFGCQRHVA